MVPLHGDESGARRGGLSAARRYTPRGRTVRETADNDRSGRGDPFRPALQVVDGGERRGARSAPRSRVVPDAARDTTSARLSRERSAAGVAATCYPEMSPRMLHTRPRAH